MSRGLSIVTGVFAFGVYACAQITIAGRVLDENGAGVAQAAVSFRGAGGEVQAAICDPWGEFTFTLAGPGRYLADVERDGYFPLKNFPVDVTGATTEVHLAVSHVREVFQSVNVAASGAAVDVDNTAAEKKLTGLEILDVPYTPTRDLRAALPLIPGVIEDNSSQLHFDGGAERQTLFLLDGFDFSDPLTGKLDTRVSVEAVRTIDWMSGRYSPEFGKGSAGALDVRTDMGDDPWRYSATNFLPGLDTRGGLHLGTWAPRFNLSGPLRPRRAWFSEHLDLNYTQPVVPDLPRGQNRTQIFQGGNLLRAQVNLTPANIVFADFLVNYEFAPHTGLDVLDPLSTTSDQRSRTYFASLKDQIYLTHRMLLEVGVAQDRNFLRVIPQGDGFYNISPFGKSGNYDVNSIQKSERSQFLANLFLPSFERAGHHQWKTGVDLDRLNYWQDLRRSGIAIFDGSGNLVRQTSFAGSGIASQPNLEVSWYALDDWKVRADLALEYGVRQDWDELLRRAALSPRVSAAWAPGGSKSTKISAGYAIVRDATPLQLFVQARDQFAIDQFFDPPMATLIERFVIPNPHLKFPDFQNWTIGWEQRLPAKINLQVTGIRKRGRNGLAYTAGDVPGVFNLTNARRDSYDAVEVEVEQRFGDQYEWMASYTRSRAHSNEVIDLSVDEPLMVANNTGPLNWDAPNRFVSWAYLPTKWKNWAVAYSVEARTGFPFSLVDGEGQITGAVNSQRFPMFFSLNLHPEWRFKAFGRRWALRGGLNNLTDHQNPTVAQTIPGLPPRLYGSEGRHFVFRIRWLGKAN